jgi:hypothetical protein
MGRRSLIALLPATCLAACATAGTWTGVTSDSSGSSYFNVGRPGVYKVDGGLQVTGRVCRLARTTVLSPPGVRLERVATSGEVVESTHANVRSISRRSDQACAPYNARVGWTLAETDSIRACLDRGHACPTSAPSKAAAAIPAATATPH